MRKLRTREHIIADLSVNHVERFILRQGHTSERFDKDYGYDLTLCTHNEQGERESGIVFLQLKATDNLKVARDKRYFAQTLALRDLELWCSEAVPVILVVYDAQADNAFYLHIQAAYSLSALPKGRTTLTAQIPRINVLNEAAIEQFRRLKSEGLPRQGGIDDES